MKKFLPIILVLAAVGVGIGVYFYLNKGQVSLPGAGNVFEGSLKMAVEKGIPLKCEWKEDENNFGSSWVKGEKVYSETTTQGKQFKMVMRDNCVWSWDETNQGTKFCYEEFDWDEMADYEVDTGVGVGETAEVSGQAPDFKCSPAAIADSKFEVPSGVNFINPQEMLEFDFGE